MVHIVIPLFDVAIFHICHEMNIVLTNLICVIMSYIYTIQKIEQI
mgnify:CR=1 FL=1